MCNSRSTIPLTCWKWRLRSTNGADVPQELRTELVEWHDCSYSPSVIHQELLARRLVPDPNIGQNERLIQWVGECDWEYSCSFTTPNQAARHMDILFQGLDTFATVRLNDEILLESDNMFIPHRIGIDNRIRPNMSNKISLLFESAVKRGRELEDQYGARFSITRDAKRMHVRKAQYQWGWDWGPKMLTSGPWLPAYIETYDARIADLYLTTKLLDDDHSSAAVLCEISIEGVEGRNGAVELTITDQTGEQFSKTTIPISPNLVTSTIITMDSPKLWWPHLHGQQHLYTASARLISPSSTRPLDTVTRHFGVRIIKVIQRPLIDDAPGKTFLFNVNGRDIFSQGGNWIPADMLIPAIGKDRYFDWVRMARRANLNMLRVWGGGVYETEDFFDACDELGMLVWHDFAFACGDYPTHPSFLELVRREAEAQMKRLRGRASLALVAGGNEDFLLADYATLLGQKKVEYETDDKGPFLDKPFPQREIYLGILPEVMKKLCPSIFYWPNSPWGGSNANDPTIGDTHRWEVWHVKQLPYQHYKSLSSRFVSEFGMHGFPDIRTVESFAPDLEDRHPLSKTIDCHNKAHGAETRIARYLAENFRYSMRLENFVYCTQLLQSEAYGYALRGWKRKFQGKGKELCAGAIIWQLNDVYPVTSWAFVDCHLRPKPAFYTVAREFASVSVGVDRDPYSRRIEEDHPSKPCKPRFDAFAHNLTTEDVSAALHLQAFDMDTMQPIELPEPHRPVKLTAGYNTELGKVEIPDGTTNDSLIVLCAKLVAGNGEILARMVNWPEPYRYLNWHPDTKVAIAVQQSDDQSLETVTVEANYPVKGCLLSLDHSSDRDGAKEPEWSDNMLDLMPGDPLSVCVKNRNGRAVAARFLNDWELQASKFQL